MELLNYVATFLVSLVGFVALSAIGIGLHALWMKFAGLRNWLSRYPLKLIAAATCGSFLTVAIAIPLILVRQAVLGQQANGPNGGAFYVSVVSVAAVMVLPFGIACMRFLLRAFPVRVDGRGVSVASLVGGVVVGVVIVNLAWGMTLGLKSGIPTSSIGLFSSVVVVGVFVASHLRARRFLKRPYVLFLRRFSTFSDRTVMGVVLRCCPPGKPVVFLVPTRSTPGDWSFLNVIFAGLKLRRPLASLPVIVEATNDAWRNVIRELVQHAETIVMDASLGGASLLEEMEMIQASGCSYKTVVLTTEKTEWARRDRLRLMVGENAEIIAYAKSWIRAVPRIAIGMFFSFFPSFIIVFSVLLLGGLLLVVPLVAIGLIAEPSVTSFLEGDSWMPFVVNATAIVYFWTGFVFFVRPSINKDSVRRLSDRLRRSTRQPARSEDASVS